MRVCAFEDGISVIYLLRKILFFLSDCCCCMYHVCITPSFKLSRSPLHDKHGTWAVARRVLPCVTAQDGACNASYVNEHEISRQVEGRCEGGRTIHSLLPVFNNNQQCFKLWPLWQRLPLCPLVYVQRSSGDIHTHNNDDPTYICFLLVPVQLCQYRR